MMGLVCARYFPIYAQLPPSSSDISLYRTTHLNKKMILVTNFTKGKIKKKYLSESEVARYWPSGEKMTSVIQSRDWRCALCATSRKSSAYTTRTVPFVNPTAVHECESGKGEEGREQAKGRRTEGVGERRGEERGSTNKLP